MHLTEEWCRANGVNIDTVLGAQDRMKNPGPYIVTIPGWHPVRLNEMIGRHWAVGAAKKKADAAIVAKAFREVGVPPARGKRRLMLTLTLAPRTRAGDPDAYWKGLCDALVHCKALRSDDRFGVELTPVAFVRGDEKATTITLEDIP